MPVLDLAQYSAYDGSGLSRHDLVCPSFLAALMAFADERYLQLLPLAGVSGTLSSRFIGTAAEGKLRAKTGTMTNVNALSGVVGNVAFSILSDSCPQPSSVVRQGIDDIAVLFAEL
jgi:D-alanyl-D-alanine carboxypeptidase/D-alanyl-D-alanine-endopeptidase (penicillin-binding protein 4)